MYTGFTARSSSPLHSPLRTPTRYSALAGMSTDRPSSDGTAAGVSLCTPIAAPVLRSVDPVKVARFLKERERYALQVPTLKVVLYTASIDRTLLPTATSRLT